MEPKIMIYYPYELKAGQKAAFKKFSKQDVPITEVSFPSDRVNVLRVETEFYSLRCRRVPNALRDKYVAFGKALVQIFSGLADGDTMEMPIVTLRLNADSIGEFQILEETTSYKRFSKGWIKQHEEGIFEDFFSDDF